jgi:Fe(3+) dicitrate transport protein
MSDAVTVFAGVQNALDDDYLVTRHPHGPRSGQPLFAYIGLEIALGSE